MLSSYLNDDAMAQAAVNHIISSDGIRRILVIPNKITREVRERIAASLASDLFGIECDAHTSDIADTVRSSAEWAQMKNLSEKNDLMPKLILRTVLSELFTDVQNALKKSWERISSIVKTMDIVSSLSPNSGFRYSVRDAYIELITDGCLTDRNDDLRSLAEMKRLMISGAAKRRYGRNVLMVVDTSNSMYGEPELIAKALILSFTQMAHHKCDVNVMLHSSDLPVLLPSDGKDMIRFLSFKAGDGEHFGGALKILLEMMRMNDISDTDLILVSKGAGILSNPSFTSDWETYRQNNGIRVITAVAGGNSACALTELSDHVVILSGDTMRTEFAKLLDCVIDCVD